MKRRSDWLIQKIYHLAQQQFFQKCKTYHIQLKQKREGLFKLIEATFQSRESALDNSASVELMELESLAKETSEESIQTRLEQEMRFAIGPWETMAEWLKKQCESVEEAIDGN
jgi:hypothetical protein